MRKPIIAGNWKMNKTASEAVDFVREIRRGLSQITLADSVVCPPFIALPAVYDVLQATKVGIGAQNMHFAEKGAFTGEVSVSMIKPYCQGSSLERSTKTSTRRRRWLCKLG